MQKTGSFAAVIAIAFMFINSAFIAQKSERKEYGFISVTIADSGKHHYMVVDIAKLKSLKAIYSCDLDGKYCQLNVNLDGIALKRGGRGQEIIEFDCDPGKVRFSGRGFRFAYSYD